MRAAAVSTARTAASCTAAGEPAKAEVLIEDAQKESEFLMSVCMQSKASDWQREECAEVCALNEGVTRLLRAFLLMRERDFDGARALLEGLEPFTVKGATWLETLRLRIKATVGG